MRSGSNSQQRYLLDGDDGNWAMSDELIVDVHVADEVVGDRKQHISARTKKHRYTVVQR